MGGILLGAVVLGTVAAVASQHHRRYTQRPTYGGDYGNGYGSSYGFEDDRYAGVDPRAVPSPANGDDYADEPNGYDRRAATSDPVADCSRAAERQAQNGGGFARVVGIDRADPVQGGANVRGRVEIGNGLAAARRSMSFSCSASFGEVTRFRLG